MSVMRSSAVSSAKQDEFYTQYGDIQKEVEAYLEFDPSTFRGKVVYCNCDDPFEGNFFKYFGANFNKLGLKKLVTTSYDGSPIAGQGTLFPEYNEGNGKRQKPKAIAVILDHVRDEDQPRGLPRLQREVCQQPELPRRDPRVPARTDDVLQDLWMTQLHDHQDLLHPVPVDQHSEFPRRAQHRHAPDERAPSSRIIIHEAHRVVGGFAIGPQHAQ
jgi:hypothetical protein